MENHKFQGFELIKQRDKAVGEVKGFSLGEDWNKDESANYKFRKILEAFKRQKLNLVSNGVEISVLECCLSDGDRGQVVIDRKFADEQIQLCRDQIRRVIKKVIGEVYPSFAAQVIGEGLHSVLKLNARNDQDRVMVFTNGDLADPDTLISILKGKTDTACWNAFGEYITDEVKLLPMAICDHLGKIIRGEEKDQKGELNPLAVYREKFKE